MTQYAIALGSNVGDRLDHLLAAVSAMTDLGELVAVSGVYETEPIGGPDQDPFLNAVLVLLTEDTPEDLLASLQAIEHLEGRERIARWGPRTLDLDIVASDGSAIDTPDLQIPHPRAGEREFVLRPLVDVWPDADVGDGVGARQALAGVSGQGVDLLSRNWLEPGGRLSGKLFVVAQFVWFAAIALLMAMEGTLADGSVSVTLVVGAGLAIVGAYLAFASSRRLGDSLTANPEPKPSAILVTSGLYAHARHPIYGGVTLFILGATLIVNSFSGALLSVLLLPFFYSKSSYEEKRLRLKYPQYRAYMERVPRRLIPFVI